MTAEPSPRTIWTALSSADELAEAELAEAAIRARQKAEVALEAAQAAQRSAAQSVEQSAASHDRTADSYEEAAERDKRRAAASDDAPFFDRGPGYARLSGGKAFADVDHL